MKSTLMEDKWEKRGIVIRPNAKYDWMLSYSMVPVIQWRYDDIYRVYFCGRDAQNRSQIGYVEIDINDPSRILNFSKKPILALGALGCFDDNGVTPSWIIGYDEKIYLYYIGWNKRSTVRMYLAAGLAVSYDKGESFERVWRVPILDRTPLEPYILNTAPCVLIEDNVWKMWYVSAIEWVHPDLPRYNIRYAESKDGINWIRKGVVCIDLKTNENALARPCVLKENGLYKMWYSYKGENYRIGYAESSDGIRWERKDQAVGIDVSENGWDSEMIEYAFVFSHGGKKHMFYNGNDYGKEGIGYAVLQEKV